MENRVVGAIVLSPTDAASQEVAMDSTQRVVVASARATRNAAVENCLEYPSALGIRSLSSRGALCRSYSSMMRFRKLYHVLRKHWLASMDRSAYIVVDTPPEVYKLVQFVVDLAC